MLSGLSPFNSQYWHQDRADVLDVGEEFDQFGSAIVTGDFNGDGFADAAIGVPGESDGGAVSVLYGSAQQLTGVQNQRWTQSDFVGAVTLDGRFGAAIEAGDFNGDEIEDLAIGIPNADVNNVNKAGAVGVLFGSREGLSIEGNQFWHQDVPSIKESVDANDLFGAALAAGDYNGDGVTDLAIGAPGKSVNSRDEAGGVAVIYGARGEGLVTAGDQFWHQDIEDERGDVVGDAESGDHYGASLAAGDFNNDGSDDLAIGVPDDEINGNVLAGGVAVVYGSRPDGLTPAGNQFWHQDIDVLDGAAEASDNFGAALAAGDFDGDSFQDLAIGVPGQRVNGLNGAGAVQILFGRSGTIEGDRNETWHQDSGDITEVAEANDRFGSSIAAGDVQDDDDVDDLIVGAPGEGLEGVLNVGVVHVIRGARDRFDVDGSLTFRPADFDLVEESGERFGNAVATGDFNQDRLLDLAIGTPFDRPEALRAGSVSVSYGTLDLVGPTVTVSPKPGQGDPVTSLPLTFDIVFSEPVTDFTIDDIQLSGVEGARVSELRGSGAAYSISVDGLSGSGTVTANVPAGVAEDAARNPNVASSNADNSINYERLVDVSINQAAGQDDPAVTGQVKFTVEFSDSVTGFTAADVLLSGTAQPTTAVVSGSDATYEVTVSGMSADGTVIATVPAAVVTPTNRASTSTDNVVQYAPPRAPSVTINRATNLPDPTSASTIFFVVLFSEPVTGFTAEDVILDGTAGATSVEVSGDDGIRFELRVTGMSQDGTVVATVPAGVVIDSDGESNSASTSDDNLVEYFHQPVTVTIEQSAGQADPTSESTVVFDVLFSEPVTGFTADDVVLSGTAGASDVAVSGSAESYLVSVSGMTQTGTVVASIGAGSVTPGNQESTSVDNLVSYERSDAAASWTNVASPFDVNNDGFVTARDVLAIINEINRRVVSDAEGRLPSLEVTPFPPGFIDVNGDGFVTALDALRAINEINSASGAAAFAAAQLHDEGDE